MTAKSSEAYRRRRLEHRSEASACSYVYSAYYSGAVLNIHVALYASLQSYIYSVIPFIKYFIAILRNLFAVRIFIAIFIEKIVLYGKVIT